jgi:thymidine phosphorylase
VSLGAGRSRLEDTVDPAVGIEILARHGDKVGEGDTVLLVRHRGGAALEAAVKRLESALLIDDAAPVVRPLILERIVNG